MTTRLDPRVRAMTEEQLQNAIIDLAEVDHWKVSFAPDWMKRLAFASMKRHPRAGRRWPKAGLPDLILVKEGRIVIAELKKHGRQPKPEQEEWLQSLAANPGVEVYVWLPEHWVSGEIERTLKEGGEA